MSPKFENDRTDGTAFFLFSRVTVNWPFIFHMERKKNWDRIFAVQKRQFGSEKVSPILCEMISIIQNFYIK